MDFEQRAKCIECGWVGLDIDLELKDVEHSPKLSQEQGDIFKEALLFVEETNKKLGKGWGVNLSRYSSKVTLKSIEESLLPYSTAEEHCPNCNEIGSIVDPDQDPHLSCYSYPNCDLAPTGCRVEMGDDVEEFGFKD